MEARGEPGGIDETTYGTFGSRAVCGCVCVTQGSALVKMAPTRGRIMIDSNFPFRRDAANTVDGYTVCQRFPCMQRCWAHILREADQISWSKAPEMVELHRILKDLYVRIGGMAAGGAFPDPGIRQKRDRMVAVINGIADRYKEAGETGFATTLSNASENLCTFLLYPGLEPTNMSERMIKQVIMHRNTRQKAGSYIGMKNSMMTCTQS